MIVVRGRVLLWLAAAALAATALAGTSAATSAKTMSVRITFTGGYKGHVNWSHIQNGSGTQLVTYGCMRWQIPGKPLRYAVIFGQAYEQKQSFLAKFDYDANQLGRAHRFRRPEFLGVVVSTPDGKVYDAIDPGKAAVTITLAPNLLSGTFDARNLHDLDNGKLNARGSWKCASLIKRTA
jgi:hypothetical protein